MRTPSETIAISRRRGPRTSVSQAAVAAMRTGLFNGACRPTSERRWCVPRIWRVRLCYAVACFIATAWSGGVAADLTFEPTWTPPSAEEVRGRLQEWLAEQPAIATPREARELSAQIDGSEGDLLDQVVAAGAVVDPRVDALVAQVTTPSVPPAAPDISWLSASDVSPWLRANLRLYVARHLVHQQLYDEAADLLADVQLEEVVDPSALLFYRMAVYHQIVQPDRARAALVQLLEREESIPVRFAKVARLVERDLASLEDDSLDHISRRMGDIRRRLAIGRAGARVQQVERGVVESLDKLIEEEEQRQQQQQQQSGSSSPQQSSRPMEDSRPAELKAPGRVDQRDIGSQSGWGDLPPKQREQALEQLGREFPVHYRELIEQYFRDLAEQSEADGP